MRVGQIADHILAEETPLEVRSSAVLALNAAIERLAPHCLNGSGDAGNHLPGEAVASLRAAFELLLRGLDAAQADPECRPLALVPHEERETL